MKPFLDGVDKERSPCRLEIPHPRLHKSSWPQIPPITHEAPTSYAPWLKPFRSLQITNSKATMSRV